MPRIFTERQGGFPEVINGLLGVCEIEMLSLGKEKDSYLPELTHKLISRKNGPEGSNSPHVTPERFFPYRKKCLYW